MRKVNRPPEIYLPEFLREKNILLSQSYLPTLPIQKNKINPFMFTMEEISARQKYHQGMADEFYKLWNEEIKGTVSMLIFDREGDVMPIDIKNARVNRLLKDFIYEMCVHHVAERTKWDICLDELIKKDPATVGKILKP